MAGRTGSNESPSMFYERLVVSLTNHSPTEDQIAYIEDVREIGKRLAAVIAESCPSGRMRSVAATKLEECVMWAVKAIVVEGAEE